ncbi:MAG: hypothetical protein LH629_11615, partial [Ignavibacteria bacterium]|nr:hypothetical protein [Ignavibacteria bacterium]
LTEHNKETEINQALNGETIFDGFIKDLKKENGKAAIREIVKDMNTKEESLSREDIQRRLEDFLA